MDEISKNPDHKYVDSSAESDDELSSVDEGHTTKQCNDGTNKVDKLSRLRKEKRLAMNRESARKRRRRKKLLIQTLESQVADLTRTTQELKAANTILAAKLQTTETDLQTAKSTITCLTVKLKSAEYNGLQMPSTNSFGGARQSSSSSSTFLGTNNRANDALNSLLLSNAESSLRQQQKQQPNINQQQLGGSMSLIRHSQGAASLLQAPPNDPRALFMSRQNQIDDLSQGMLDVSNNVLRSAATSQKTAIEALQQSIQQQRQQVRNINFSTFQEGINSDQVQNALALTADWDRYNARLQATDLHLHQRSAIANDSFINAGSAVQVQQSIKAAITKQQQLAMIEELVSKRNKSNSH